VYPKPFLERADVTLTTLIETVERNSARTFLPLGMDTQPADADAANSNVSPAAAGD
jgi:hypothetical protein